MASAAFEEIVEDFEFLDDWEDRYRHVIDLGKAMEDLDAAFKVDVNKAVSYTHLTLPTICSV